MDSYVHILDMDGWRLCDGSAGDLDRDVFGDGNRGSRGLPSTGAFADSPDIGWATCPRCLDVWNARLVQECLERTA